MGILIKGMEMPKDRPAWIAIFPSGDVYLMDQKWKDVKAVTIPAPHGNLIDRSKIGLTDFEIAMFDGDFRQALIAYIDKVESAPAVVEAEGDEE